MKERCDSEEDEKEEDGKDGDGKDGDEESVHLKHVTVRSKNIAFEPFGNHFCILIFSSFHALPFSLLPLGFSSSFSWILLLSFLSIAKEVSSIFTLWKECSWIGVSTR